MGKRVRNDKEEIWQKGKCCKEKDGRRKKVETQGKFTRGEIGSN